MPALDKHVIYVKYFHKSHAIESSLPPYQGPIQSDSTAYARLCHNQAVRLEFDLKSKEAILLLLFLPPMTSYVKVRVMLKSKPGILKAKVCAQRWYSDVFQVTVINRVYQISLDPYLSHVEDLHPFPLVSGWDQVPRSGSWHERSERWVISEAHLVKKQPSLPLSLDHVSVMLNMPGVSSEARRAVRESCCLGQVDPGSQDPSFADLSLWYVGAVGYSSTV